jgi:alpha-ribazole phosphatase
VSRLILDLLRHGETEAGHCFLGRTDAVLTDQGWVQMQSGLAGVSPRDYEGIYSSPLQRCSAFATFWAGNVVTVEPRLIEYDFGRWDGLTAADVHASDPDALGRFWQDSWHCPPPEGESLESLFTRLERLVDELKQVHTRPVLLICHGGVIRALHCILNQRPVSEMFSFPVEHGSLHRMEDRRQ